MGCRPSELLFIEEELAAYCLDRAVTMFGAEVEASIAEATREVKNEKEAQRKAQWALAKWLREPGQTQGMFKDPARR